MNAINAALVVLFLSLLALAGTALPGIFGVVIPYAAIAIFLAGFVYRVIKWARVPVPFHVPAVGGQQKSLPWIKQERIESPTTTLGVIGRMAMEVLLFRSLFRNEKVELKRKEKLVYGGHKYLWLLGLAFHWSLLIILIRHTRFLFEPVPSAVTFLQNLDSLMQLPVFVLYITDIVILVAVSYLVVRRIVFPQMRYISLAADYLAVMLLLAVVVTGILMNYIFSVDTVKVKELAMGVLSFQPVVPEGLSAMFFVHLFLVSALIAYFPFSKMMHLVGVLLSPTRNLKNDSRARRHVNPWNPPVKVHTYEEYEDENRQNMKNVGLPVDKES